MKQKEETSQSEGSVKNIQKENQAIFEELTNKNSNYFYKLSKELDERGLKPPAIQQAIHPLLVQAHEKQSQGLTARRLFGRVSERADKILNVHSQAQDSQHEEVVLSEDWKLYVDGALLVGGVFTLISGLSVSFTENPEANQLGLISMIANFVIGGFVMLAITKTAPRPNQKNNYLKYFAASLGSIALWAVIAALINLYVPAAINPIVPSSLCIIIGAGSLAAKWLFKRRYDVKGGIF